MASSGSLKYNPSECARHNDWRESMWQPELPENPRVLDNRTFRLDEPGDTITVNAMKSNGGREPWIRAIGWGSYEETVKRAHALDVKMVAEIFGSLQKEEPQDFLTYQPHTADFEGMDKFSRVAFSSACWRGLDRDRAMEGQLPSIEQLKYDGRLSDVPLNVIENQIKESAKGRDARMNVQTWANR